jgi:Bacteriocin-protection, YdeI or OmpD-Associated/Domain of unknown function (DU1801)
MPPATPQTPDAYFKAAPAYAQPILAHIRALVHRACPGAKETIKWSHVFFDDHGLLCMVAAFKGHCSLGFWHQGMKPVLVERGFPPRQGAGDFGPLRTVGDLPKDTVLLKLIKEAAALNAAGGPARAPGKVKKAAAVPADLAQALKAAPSAGRLFAAFSPSAQREYIEWITEAKREETRAQRLATTVAWVAEGKKRNWKYAGC